MAILILAVWLLAASLETYVYAGAGYGGQQSMYGIDCFLKGFLSMLVPFPYGVMWSANFSTLIAYVYLFRSDAQLPRKGLWFSIWSCAAAALHLFVKSIPENGNGSYVEISLGPGYYAWLVAMTLPLITYIIIKIRYKKRPHPVHISQNNTPSHNTRDA